MKTFQQQDLKEFYRHIITLNCGKTIEILTEEDLKWEQHYLSSSSWTIEGFITTPMIISKDIRIRPKDISAIETTLEPFVCWKDTELEESDEINKD